MPLYKGTDSVGTYYQWGSSGTKYYVRDYGANHAREHARRQGVAIMLSQARRK